MLAVQDAPRAQCASTTGSTESNVLALQEVPRAQCASTTGGPRAQCASTTGGTDSNVLALQEARRAQCPITIGGSHLVLRKPLSVLGYRKNRTQRVNIGRIWLGFQWFDNHSLSHTHTNYLGH